MKRETKFGKVYLVGAGPGDPGLLTLKGKTALEVSDVVVYDALASEVLLSYARAAKRICVGKRGGRESSPPQSKINQLLKRLARQGKNVVRLKGGDPYIFGRGGEEALFLSQERIPFEVIPGVTAALGAAASCGIPLTHRDWSSQVTFVTAHQDPAKKSARISWESLAQNRGTLVFYMGMMGLEEVVEKLVRHGRGKGTAVAVVQWATTAHEKVVEGTLGDIVRRVRLASLASPAVTIVGPVVKFRRKLCGHRDQPLHGKTVLVTRARQQAGSLSDRLAEKGARVVECPTIEILPPEDWTRVDRAISELPEYDWVIFTSVNGVEKFLARVQACGKDARAFHACKICAIGPATAAKLREHHLDPDLVPPEYVSEALAEDLASREDLGGKKILIPRSDVARDYLVKALTKRGACVEPLVVYRTQGTPANGSQALVRSFKRGDIDFVTFTSSSTVKHFVSLVGKKTLRNILPQSRWISIGPVTSKTAREMGIRIHRQATSYTIPGLVDAIVKG